MVRQNVVVDKSKAFAIRVIRMYQWLSNLFTSIIKTTKQNYNINYKL